MRRETPIDAHTKQVCVAAKVKHWVGQPYIGGPGVWEPNEPRHAVPIRPCFIRIGGATSLRLGPPSTEFDKLWCHPYGALKAATLPGAPRPRLPQMAQVTLVKDPSGIIIVPPLQGPPCASSGQIMPDRINLYHVETQAKVGRCREKNLADSVQHLAEFGQGWPDHKPNWAAFGEVGPSVDQHRPTSGRCRAALGRLRFRTLHAEFYEQMPKHRIRANLGPAPTSAKFGRVG